MDSLEAFDAGWATQNCSTTQVATKVCRFWKAGKCKFGQKCRYSHAVDVGEAVEDCGQQCKLNNSANMVGIRGPEEASAAKYSEYEGVETAREHSVHRPACVAVRVPIDSLRFSQNSCSEEFKGEGRTIWETADRLGRETRRRDIPMVRAYSKDAEYHALDHRRLAALKIASHRGDIPGTVVADILDDKQAAKEYRWKNKTKSEGERMKVSGTDVEIDCQGQVLRQGVVVENRRGWRPSVAEDSGSPQTQPQVDPQSAHGAEKEMPLRAGMSVCIVGLQTRPKLNGKTGYLVKYDAAKARWQVRVAGDDILLKSGSLRVDSKKDNGAPPATQSSGPGTPGTPVCLSLRAIEPRAIADAQVLKTIPLKERTWIVSTAYSHDVIGRESLTVLERTQVFECPEVTVMTSSGEFTSSKYVDIPLCKLGLTISCIVLDRSPAVLSVGRRCQKDGFDFSMSSRGVFFATPDSRQLECVWDRDQRLCLPIPIQQRRWIVEFYSHDVIGKDCLTAIECKSISNIASVEVKTPFGILSASEVVDIRLEHLGIIIPCLVVEGSPPILSVGRRCMSDGFGFQFKPGGLPYFQAPGGGKHECELHQHWFTLIA